ncbi:hypothetical protein PRIPAC_96556 [Pristionchus pacificus]|uniref:CMP/dCMP-type deaminase domain-containing protein n=1 Tax=Pristionchus pacificus TaxID=54126 RepID=A0A454XQV5_PRIPA|nr:hypothetical protein PRIPAC_96556 [Pristionchus pacificus]|eukprot:PDM84193.1 hypothetical protein PRIPAC_33216 [Pristionchus pacificus]
MEATLREACVRVAAGDGGPFGAAIVKDGKIVAVGHNMVLINIDPTCDAEMTAIAMLR